MNVNDYKNKYFSILGDSISTLDGYSQPKGGVYYDTARKLSLGVATSVDTWWGQVIERLQGKLLVNNSWSGSTVCWSPAYEIPAYACSDERTSALDKEGTAPDVIIIYMGVNDWGTGRQVLPNQNANDTSVFLTAYQEMLKKLKINYPQAEIWCLTLPISRCSAKANFEFPYYYNGEHIDSYCQAIRESAETYGCRVVDLFKNCEPYDTVDGFHPNASGMQTIAKAVLDCLK